MRTAFIEELAAQARTHPDIFLVVGDLGYSVVERFRDEFPKRFLNAGVAEQNMMGVAAGLASEGFHVFTYSIANFGTFRAAEQIRNDVAYHQLPVTVVAVGGGLAYGNLGYSHHAVQDYALLRSFPNMTICAPGDPHETRGVVQFLAGHDGPAYLRLGKAGEPLLHPETPRTVPGEILCLQRAAGGRTFLTTGATLKMALDLARTPPLADRWSVCSLPVWGNHVRASVRDFVKRFTRVVTLEDHLQSGGFGSYVRECLEDEPVLQERVRCCALSENVCGLVADQATLNRRGGLDPEALTRAMGS